MEARSNLYSDAPKSYGGLSADYEHQVIDHAVEYVRENVYSNGLDNWSLLKRAIGGTYVAVEPYDLFPMSMSRRSGSIPARTPTMNPSAMQTAL